MDGGQYWTFQLSGFIRWNTGVRSFCIKIVMIFKLIFKYFIFLNLWRKIVYNLWKFLEIGKKKSNVKPRPMLIFPSLVRNWPGLVKKWSNKVEESWNTVHCTLCWHRALWRHCAAWGVYSNRGNLWFIMAWALAPLWFYN